MPTKKTTAVKRAAITTDDIDRKGARAAFQGNPKIGIAPQMFGFGGSVNLMAFWTVAPETVTLPDAGLGVYFSSMPHSISSTSGTAKEYVPFG